MRALYFLLLVGCLGASASAEARCNREWLDTGPPDTKLDELICEAGQTEQTRLEVMRVSIEGYGTLLVEGVVYQRDDKIARGARMSVGPYGQSNSSRAFLIDEDEVLAMSRFLDEAIALSARPAPKNKKLSVATVFRTRDDLTVRAIQGELGGLHLQWWDEDLVLQPDQAARFVESVSSLNHTLGTLSKAER